MPIPQLYKTKSPQKWRNKKKRYYLAKNNYRRPWRNKSIPQASDGANGLIKTTLKKLRMWAAVFLIIAAVLGLAIVSQLSRGLPDPNHLIDRQVAQSTKIYDRSGQTILYEIHGAEKRTLVNLEEIPDYLKWATVAIEDKDFYRHGGFSVWAMFRTAITNILRHQKAGGSTLTQQLIKNAILSPEKTYTRKIKELLLAYRVEKKFSKDEILQLYLNEIPYGSTAYGVEAASRRYFNKSVKEITLAEAAVLAALPQAPSRYSPYGSNQDLLIARQHYILDLMAEQNYISAEQAAEAKNQPIVFAQPGENIIAPHFVMYVKEMLSEKYGEKMIEQEGLSIYTTLDLYKQNIAETVIEERTEYNKTNYNSWNAGLISLDPKTGQILAMVGSRDYFGQSEPEGCQSGKNCKFEPNDNVTIRGRQPGSSFKPIVYAAAFIKGYTPDTVLYDVVTNFSHDPDDPYEPHNYDGQEHGPVTIRKALAGSLNIPAVKTIYLTGIDNVLNLADNLGYSTLADRSRFGLSLVLGGGEVKLIEHANAYSAFARDGELHPATAILKIVDQNGKVIEEYKDRPSKVVDSQIVRLINNILSDNSARAYAFGEQNWLTLSARPVAAKTGTTNDYHDGWTIGYTPSLVTGVWVGNNDNSAMKRGAAGGVVAAPIWHNYMERVLGDTPVEYFKQPAEIKTGKTVLDGETSGEITVKIDKASGLLASEHTPANYIEEKLFRQVHSILYYLNKDDPRGEAPLDPSQDPQFQLWEQAIINWAEQQNIATSAPPTEFDNLHKPENRPSFAIAAPDHNQTINQPILEAAITAASAPRGIDRAEYYLDNNLLAISKSYPFNLKTNIGFLNNGFHGLSIRVCDNIDNCSEQSTVFNLSLDNQQYDSSFDLSWLSPQDNITIDQNNFPLALKMHVINPLNVQKIKLYYLPDGLNEPQLLATIEPVESSQIEMLWIETPNSGINRLYGEAYGWNGQNKQSETVAVTIK